MELPTEGSLRLALYGGAGAMHFDFGENCKNPMHFSPV